MRAVFAVGLLLCSLTSCSDGGSPPRSDGKLPLWPCTGGVKVGDSCPASFEDCLLDTNVCGIGLDPVAPMSSCRCQDGRVACTLIGTDEGTSCAQVPAGTHCAFVGVPSCSKSERYCGKDGLWHAASPCGSDLSARPDLGTGG